MKTIICIPSCVEMRKFKAPILETWLKDSPIEYKFFIGEGEPEEDEKPKGKKPGKK